jgi:hypothetical protein
MKSLVFPVCCLIALALFGGCETKQVRYDTVAEARNAGLFSRGWAPDVLPEGAGPIAESHNLDTNARCFRATFSPDSLEAVQSALVQEGFATDSKTTAAWPSPEEFCSFSRSDVEAGQLLYRSTEQSQYEYAAVRGDSLLYFWSNGDVLQ